MMSHVRGFVTWLWGQRHDQVLLNPIGLTQIEAYLEHLKNQDYQISTIKRKRATLRIFNDWIERLVNTSPEIETTALDKVPLSSIEEDGSTLPPARPSQVKIQTTTNRYQAVLALANQGLDRSTIAAHTGLEQDAVRMLLTGQFTIPH